MKVNRVDRRIRPVDILIVHFVLVKPKTVLLAILRVECRVHTVHWKKSGPQLLHWETFSTHRLEFTK